jgi:hypothetical protein
MSSTHVKRNVSGSPRSDACPRYATTHDALALLQLLNGLVNVLLHCVAGRQRVVGGQHARCRSRQLPLEPVDVSLPSSTTTQRYEGRMAVPVAAYRTDTSAKPVGARRRPSCARSPRSSRRTPGGFRCTRRGSRFPWPPRTPADSLPRVLRLALRVLP